MAHFLAGLAEAASRRWKRSLAIAFAVLALLGVGAGLAAGSFADEFSTPGTESQAALDLLQERFPAQSGDTATVVFSVEDGTVRDGDRSKGIESTVAEIAKQPHVTGVANPLEGDGQVSRDGKIAFATVQYDQPSNELGREPGERLADASKPAESAGVEVSRRGQVVDQAEQSEAPIGELIGIALAVLVLTLVFRSWVAMAITLVTSLIALAAGVLMLTIGSAFIDLPSFAPTLGVMLGLGAGIDYALLIVGRYREQLAAGDEPHHAARVANATAGTSVIAAGAIVVVAIAGLLATGIPFVGRMGVGSAIVVATVAIGAVTLLPVMMGAAAKRLRPKKPEHVNPSPRFAAWGQRIVAHPWRSAIAGGLVLVVLAAPITGLRLGQPDDGNDAGGTTTRVAYDKLGEGFGAGFNGPLVVAVSLPSDGSGSATLSKLEKSIGSAEDVAAVAPAQLNQARDAATITVIPKSSPQDERTSELVTRLRDNVIPGAVADSDVKAYVGGATATFDDLSTKIAERLPIFIALVVGLSVLLLMAVFRSLWVPIVSAGFNLLSIGAAYGLVVAVFQWGWGSQLLGVSGEVPIVSFVPLFMFAVLFGLSMDYNVFLQSRIREEYHRGLRPSDSVVVALSRVGRIILGAGAIMTGVFLGFVTDPDVIVKTIGFGLAAAILIDVLIVRMVVAPAVMTLLGDRAWYLPAWLDRVLPKISLEGEGDDRPAEAPVHRQPRRRARPELSRETS